MNQFQSPAQEAKGNHIECPLCGSRFINPVLIITNKSSTFRCKDCHSFFNDIDINTDTFYDKDYYTRNYTPKERRQSTQSKIYCETLRKYVSGGAVLDYGCGSGQFLKAAIEAGYTDNAGADVSADALQLASGNSGNRILTIQLPVEKLPERKFDVITLMDSISHIRNVRTVLSDLLGNHLSENGALVIRTPEVRPSYMHLMKLLSNISPGHASNLMFARSRYALFDRNTIRHFLESIGFEIIHFEIKKDYPIDQAADKTVKNLILFQLLRILNAQLKSMFIIAKSRGQVAKHHIA